ncbi:Zinc finger, RING-type [Sesbania bispinosa]|nr:Zinc finger, RING-type [Sesbania bispinosa]
MTNPIDASIMNMYNTNAGNYSSLLPLSGTTTASETLLPPLYNSFIADSFPQKATAMKSDNSTLTYNNNNVGLVPRKRSRDTMNNYPLPSYKNCGTTFSFLGEDISHHIHQQQLDIDNLVSQHMEKVRVELEEKRKRQARRLMEEIEVGMMKRLKAKDEEIEKIGKLNFALEERVKTLCIENQIWRDLAQTNEATANALRTNLEHVLAQLRDDGEDATVVPPAAAPVEEDAESCCGSNDVGWRTVASDAYDKSNREGTSRIAMNNETRRLCRNCGKEESCVLILPCRHLCLCTLCGSTLHTCPICKSYKNASVHVNMT